MNIVTALRAAVQLGLLEIEGYLLPERLWTPANKFGVSQTQAALMAYPNYKRNRAATKYSQCLETKVGKSLAPNGLQLHRDIKTNSGKADAAKVNLLPLDQLLVFLKICKKLGSQPAEDLLDALAGLSLQQLFHDAFELEFGIESRQNYMREWQIERQRLRDVHSGMQQAAMRRHHPAALVHDYMTKLICGDTAKEARMKELVDPNADPTIGLNYREEIEDMKKLTKAKVAYAYMKKEAPWQEQVERAVAKQ